MSGQASRNGRGVERRGLWVTFRLAHNLFMSPIPRPQAASARLTATSKNCLRGLCCSSSERDGLFGGRGRGAVVGRGCLLVSGGVDTAAELVVDPEVRLP